MLPSHPKRSLRRPAIIVLLMAILLVTLSGVILMRTKNSLECTTTPATPETTEAWFQQGNEQYERGSLLQALIVFPAQSRECYLQAVTSYSQSLQGMPNAGDVLNNRANAYVGLQQYNLAISDYRHILRMDPDNLNGHLGLARAYERNGQVNLAVTEYEVAIGLMEGSTYWTQQRPEVLAQYQSELEGLRSKVQ